MMRALRKGRYQARLATGDSDLARAQALRHRAFFGSEGRDQDRFDAACAQVLVEDVSDPGTGPAPLVATFRYQLFDTGAQIRQGYAAQSYDMSGLQHLRAPLLELGRFCLSPDCADPDVVRLAWGAITQVVDRAAAVMLFGCVSFPGTDPAAHAPVFAALARDHLAPEALAPRIKAPEVIRFADLAPKALGAAAVRPLAWPPLLRSYLGLGGWVSDHAVVDRAMNTLHVLTCVEVALIPEARKRVLRAVAQ